MELVREPDAFGESFRFNVNGRAVFARGANVIPLDHFSPRADSSRYRELFEAAAHANMNMLRVWGGGIYETDRFYDLADEYGILIWQDFMFANGLYPWDPDFLDSVRSEARDQVRRLRDHPSLALWCGNNEIAEGWANWGWQSSHGYSAVDSVEAWAGYQALFHGVLPEILSELDPGRPYWPSSPSIGWGHAESLERGDSHYWGVWWGREPFEVYAEKLPRFASEFGFQAYPAPATMETFASTDELRLGSPEVRAHQKHPTGVETLRVYLERELGAGLTDRLLARAGWSGPAEEGGLRDFALMTQLLQARGMDVALRAHRMSPRTDGTLYWQMNDTWPVASWSGVDYFGRRKGLHWAARSAFAPVALAWDPERRRVISASDLSEPMPGRVEFAWSGPARRGEALGDEADGDQAEDDQAVEGGLRPAILVPGRGLDLAALELPELPPGSLVGVRFVPDEGPMPGEVASGPTEGDASLARFTWTVGRWADLTPHPDGSGVEVSTDAAPGGATYLTVRARRAAVGVHLEADRPGVLSDDFFDLLPGEERRIRFVPVEVLAGPVTFRVWSLNEALARLNGRGPPPP
jgi:beta-galactosidase/beta-glucuronidase